MSVVRLYAGAILKYPVSRRFRVKMAERGRTRQNGLAIFRRRFHGAGYCFGIACQRDRRDVCS